MNTEIKYTEAEVFSLMELFCDQMEGKENLYFELVNWFDEYKKKP